MFLTYVLLQSSIIGFPIIVQIVNYVMLVINAVYTLIFATYIAPTYKEHKIMMKDYNDRISPAAIELAKIEKEKVNKCLEDIATIKHTLNNQQNALSGALERREDLQDLIETLQALTKNLKSR